MERSDPGARRPLTATAPAATTTAGGEVGVLVGGSRLRLLPAAALAALTVLTPLTGLTASASPVLAHPVLVRHQMSSPAIRAGSSGGGTLIGSGSSAIESEPTQAQLEAQQRMAVLDSRVAAKQDSVAKAQASLQVAALAAGAALQRYSEAARVLQGAELEDQHQRDLLSQAEANLAAQRHLLGLWARAAYQDGAAIGDDLGVISLFGAQSTDDVSTTLTWLRRVGDARSRAVDGYEQAQAAQAVAADRADAAAEAAAQASATAASAKAAADAAVQSQRQTLARLEQDLAQTAAEAAVVREELFTSRAGFEAAMRLPDWASTGNRVTGVVGDCTGGDVQNYPNGQIPLSVLCPLAASPSQYLRADAAFAFGRLTKAYTAHFGTPPCITDSYRPLEVQIRLYAEKPALAAVPGTSNHGWGTALDLCGGIQSFGTVQHEWMLLNAPLYGWFHPGWAQATGSKPEPWHWEFGG